MNRSETRPKRVRIISTIGETGNSMSQNPEVMESALHSLSNVSLQEKRCVLKSLPKMSDEMTCVMSSFERLALTEVGYSECEGSEDSNVDKNVKHFDISGICDRKAKSAMYNGRTTFPLVNKKPTLQRTGVVALRVYTAANAMRARLNSCKATAKHEKVKVRRSFSDAECCSAKTKKLLARSTNVYGRIDSLRENLKLTRSGSCRLPTKDLDPSELSEESVQSSSVRVDNGANRLAMVRSKKEDRKSQRLDEETIQKETPGQKGLTIPPLGKLRSASIA